MTKHELHCTLNPNRKCRACILNNGGYGCDLQEAMALLPDPTDYNNEGGYLNDSKYFDKMMADIKEAMPKLREYTDHCPACIMAALRQKKIPLPMVDGFDFKIEMQAVFTRHHNENADYGC
ncbi:MAG: hypothetical protein V4605_03330 [Pseudomonadota bacterium]